MIPPIISVDNAVLQILLLFKFWIIMMHSMSCTLIMMHGKHWLWGAGTEVAYFILAHAGSVGLQLVKGTGGIEIVHWKPPIP